MVRVGGLVIVFNAPPPLNYCRLYIVVGGTKERPNTAVAWQKSRAR